VSAAAARVLPYAGPSPSEGLRDAAVAAASQPREWAAPNLGALWRAVADGRYRLVECFDRGGCRYYVLYENVDDLPCALALDARERALAEAVGRGESEKAVAFTMGVTPSAVSAILRTTLLKLGLRTRIELALLVGALGAPSSSRDALARRIMRHADA
jgi:hypothetical protein